MDKDLVKRVLATGLISSKDLHEFLELGNTIANREITAQLSWIEFYHKAEIYKRLLGKVLDILVKLKEPFAEEKRNIYLEELGTTGPAVYHTPWELTLEYLDSTVNKG